jgi:hypothetical protein
MPLQTQVLINQFEKWALDFMGYIFPMSRKNRYILVCTNYVTKWVEYKYILHDTEQAIVDFLFEVIFSRFGVPREIGTDQGTNFTSKFVHTII